MGFLGMGPWVLNFTQYSWSAMNAKVLADIQSPYLEYNVYCTFKSMQIASFIGGCVVHPFYRIYLHRKLTPENRTNNSYKVIRSICRKLQGRILIASIALSPAISLSAVLLNNYTTEDVRDKCYEIRCSNDSLLYDRSTVVIGLMGWYWKRFQGAVDGINIAGAYALFHINVAKKYFNPFSLDKLTEKDRFASVDEALDDESAIIRFSHSGAAADSLAVECKTP